MSRLRSTLVVALIGAISMAAAAPRDALPQPLPDSAPAARVRVDSTEINLTVHPSFTFAIGIPTVLHFESFAYNGQQLLHVWAISRADSLQARITRATSYERERPGIFTPLIEPPNPGAPIIGYVDRIEFERAVQRALRDLNPERRLSYHRRLT